jgi:phospholipase/carboxylesterase
VSAGIDALAHEVRPARGEPEGALVLLHGRGADERDLVPLLGELDPERRFVGITPRAPLRLAGGFHWYVSRAVGHPDHDTFHRAYDLLAGWLDALPEAIGVPWSRTVLGGFSMGAVMAYALGFGAGRPAPAGNLELSGFIPAVDGFDLALSGREGYRVAIGHGIQDPVISVEFARAARRRLEDAGMRVLYRESRMFHDVDPVFLHVLRNWLADVVPAAQRSA